MDKSKLEGEYVMCNKNVCFADLGDECVALEEKDCKGCVFFKTEKDLEISEEKRIKRLLSLDKSKQDYIKKKYKLGDGFERN